MFPDETEMMGWRWPLDKVMWQLCFEAYTCRWCGGGSGAKSSNLLNGRVSPVSVVVDVAALEDPGVDDCCDSRELAIPKAAEVDAMKSEVKVGEEEEEEDGVLSWSSPVRSLSERFGGRFGALGVESRRF